MTPLRRHNPLAWIPEDVLLGTLLAGMTGAGMAVGVLFAIAGG